MGKALKKRELPLHIMLVPAVLITLVYSYGPMFGLIIAFEKLNVAKGIFRSDFVGLENFIYVLKLNGIFQIIFNTFLISLLKISGMIIVPVFVSILLNEVANIFFKRFFQTLVYIPYFISWVVISGMLMDLLSPSNGMLNNFFKIFGIQPIFFLGDNFWFRITIVITDLWKNFGFGTVIFLAALTNIDNTLYEASNIDGANRWKQTIYVTLPGIRPIVILMTVLSLGNILNAGFEQIFTLYSPVVYQSGDIIDTFVYRLGLIDSQYGPATAVGIFKSVVSTIFIVVSYKLADVWAGYKII